MHVDAHMVLICKFVAVSYFESRCKCVIASPISHLQLLFKQVDTGMHSGKFTPKCFCHYRTLAGKKLGTSLPQSSADYSSLTSLILLDLSNNDFTGSVPPIGQLTSLQTLELEGNSFTGPLPQLAGFASLTVVNFQENQLTGELWPGLICQLFSLASHLLSIRWTEVFCTRLREAAT